MRFKDCTIHCKYCQSFPTNYVCTHSKMIVQKDKETLFRECVHCYNVYDPNWKLFPCPFMDGEIRFHVDRYTYDTLEVKEGAFMES